MIAFEDGSGGVRWNYSSFMPARHDLEIKDISKGYLRCLKFLQSGFAFKICDSLISCATHKK